MPDSAMRPRGATRAARLSASASSADARMLATTTGYVAGASSSGKQTASASPTRSEEHTSELQSLMRTSYAALCLKTNTYGRLTIATHKRGHQDNSNTHRLH